LRPYRNVMYLTMNIVIGAIKNLKKPTDYMKKLHLLSLTGYWTNLPLPSTNKNSQGYTWHRHK